MNGGTERAAMAAAAGQFNDLIALVRRLVSESRIDQAAAVAEIAALHGAYNHHGALTSTALEDCLQTIGKKMARAPANSAPRVQRDRPRVLHVLTAAKDVGGDSRFVWRWIQRDKTRCHSVAVTRQRHFEIPAAIREATAVCGGTVHVLDDEGPDIARRARKLREAAVGVDVVFLHVYVEDVIPSIAFADRANLPPIVFVMQADHQFVTGLPSSNLVLHMRASGAELSLRRRGVRADRLTFLPIPLDPVTREKSRAEAKKSLGLPDDCTLLLSIARAGKYAGAQPPSFTEAGARLLERYPKAQLIVLGPKDVGEWRAVRERTNGRFRALGERSDTRDFYEAADVYLDSYPFSSNTSLLEAGGYGVPLVSFFGYSPAAAVLGAGTPALDQVLKVAHGADEYATAVAELIENRALREQVGERTRDAVQHFHYGAGWQQHLDETYERIGAADAALSTGAPVDPATTDLDALLSRIFRDSVPLGVAIERRARELSWFARLGLLRRLMSVDRSFGFGLFLPQPLETFLSPYLRGWRETPVARFILARR